ncbi:MAG: hypothetical protein CMH83_19510 [Nocardioides sp.]|nr:hypothetical protein [Nocardioides sp.]
MLDASRAAVKPNWTVDDYNRHVAEHIAEALRPLLDRLERAEGKVARVWEYLDDVANPQAPGWPTLNVTRLVAALEPAPDALAADLPGAEGR